MVAPVDPCTSNTDGGHVPKHHPAPLLGPGSGLAMTLASLARGLGWLYLLDHAKPEKGHEWRSSLHLAAFQVGVKAACCFPGDELGCAWGHLQYS